MLGVLYAEGRRSVDENRVVLRQDIVDPALDAVAGAVELSGDGEFYRYDAELTPLRASLRSLVGRAVAQDRLIVSWSCFDKNIVVEFGTLDREGLTAFRARFRDGKATARRWRHCTRPDAVLGRDSFGGTHKLARYFELTAFDVPRRYGVGLVAENLPRVETGVAKKGTFARLTPGQREVWKDVLEHNRYDCVGLRRDIIRPRWCGLA